jgi:hypothetical protein
MHLADVSIVLKVLQCANRIVRVLADRRIGRHGKLSIVYHSHRALAYRSYTADLVCFYPGQVSCHQVLLFHKYN